MRLTLPAGTREFADRDRRRARLGSGELHRWRCDATACFGGGTADAPARVLTGAQAMALGGRHMCVVISAMGEIRCSGNNTPGSSVGAGEPWRARPARVTTL
ncbi:MAG: hypothetical protein U0324_15625 [Polyangiales bacterium]